ncbi:uncharacterized protein LOC114765577 isoform X2 [Denticeps clupeoides]|uniref:uncharacterized protein LOC114765577 isoform X2 n=1 Tax=Denticeps clupeoides TaxID=299321 RepID=UPI0010A31FE5|nr:uncharacterized protein LOC114765577 isoform X2 [Denticeps clupeoides]
MRALLYLVVLSVIVGFEGLQVEGPSGPLQVQLGDSVLLPCSVRTPVPLEELEVLWKRTDLETVVLLFQDGEVRGESQEPEFRNRTHFFTEEISRGNFSLFLTDVTPADAGMYRCSVHTDTEYGDATALIQHVERLVVTGEDRPVFAYAGQEVVLSCSVDSHVLPEQVTWNKRDASRESVLVLLFEDNNTWPDSSHERYQGRAELFPAEIHKGNFSLRLKDVRTEDKGDYVCQVHTSYLSANTTAELQALGFSWQHILVLIFCFTALVLVLLLWTLKMRGTSGWELKHHSLLVFCPNVCLIIAYVLWWWIEGSTEEVVSCSVLFLSRFFLLFAVVPDNDKFPEFLIRTSFYIETLVTAGIFNFGLVYERWNYVREGKAGLIFTGGFAVVLLIFFLAGLCYFKETRRHRTFRSFLILFLDLFYILRLFFGSRSVNPIQLLTALMALMALMALVVLLALLALLIYILSRFNIKIRGCHHLQDKSKRICKVFLVPPHLLLCAFFLYFYCQHLKNDDGTAGSLSVVVLLQILSLCEILDRAFEPKFAEKPRRILYISGTVGLCAVNSITLATELIMKAERGERTVEDLRLVVFPFECFLLCGWLALCVYYMRGEILCCGGSRQQSQTRVEQEEMLDVRRVQMILQPQIRPSTVPSAEDQPGRSRPGQGLESSGHTLLLQEKLKEEEQLEIG